MSKARDLANASTALSAVSATELAFLDGVTSAVQTQIDTKIAQATAINPTLVDAKGDIIAATAADTVARLAVGATNGMLLTVDSAAATGLKYALPAAPSSPTSASSRVDANQTTSSTSYTGLTTAQAVTLTTGTKVAVFMAFAAYRSPATANQGANATYNISGATTYTGDNSNALMIQVMPGTAEQVRYSMIDFKTVTAGSNTFTMRFAVNPGNSVNFLQRQIAVIDLGS